MGCESEATDTAAGEGSGSAGIARGPAADRQGGGSRVTGGPAAEAAASNSTESEEGRRRNLVNAEHRDEVAFCQAPPRRSISTKTLRMVMRLYDRREGSRHGFPERVRW